MKTFKFFTKTTPTQYDGEWSQMAIRFVDNYVSGRFTSGQRIITEDAEYFIVEITYSQGELAGAVVKVYPTRDTNMTVTYWISMGRVTPFITDHSIVYRTEE
jgi:hypothetical protein